MITLTDERQLIAACIALIDNQFELTRQEKYLACQTELGGISRATLSGLTKEIQAGKDPLGDAFSSMRSAEARRVVGAVYTPSQIVRSMVSWVASHVTPDRVVDAGAGSGRYILEAGRVFPKADLVAIELDPLGALMLRAKLAACGWVERATVLVQDYREVQLPGIGGVTAFVGNPPYVRHHEIEDKWKAWYASEFAKLGIKASTLAGLHLHFFLKTYLLAKDGDTGAFITSSEWLDVNYGSALRQLLTQKLGGSALHMLEPEVEAFPGTQTTATITCFNVGNQEASLRVRSVARLSGLNGLTKGVAVEREKLAGRGHWSSILRPVHESDDARIEIGEFFRVHRGQVTGANNVWIAGEHSEGLPTEVLIPSVTKAKDLIQAGATLESDDLLKRVVDLPADLERFSMADRKKIEDFLAWARAHSADQSYIAQHRKAWWSVGLKAPAPILCTYMARRPPQFTLNLCGARHINVAHGLYPREELDKETLVALVAWLNRNVNAGSGRVYAGGLAKFEPKEIERLKIPALEGLVA